MSPVRYLGVVHYMRAKSLVAEAATLVESSPRSPDTGALIALLGRFAAITPAVPRHLQTAYFVALIHGNLAARGRAVDSLGLYLLKAALEKH